MYALIALLLACSCGDPVAPPPGPATDKPVATDIVGGRTNVLLIFIDTLRADHVGCYGYDPQVSPNLDKLCNEAVVFDEYYANAPWTRPSMGVILTGKYARSIGIYEEQYDKLPRTVSTLAERMQDKGYTTLGVTANPNVNSTFNFEQGFDHYADSGTVWGWMKRKEGQTKFKDDLNNSDNATTVTDRALSVLDAQVTPDTPFFLQLVYIDPHSPYAAKKKYKLAVKKTGSKVPGYDGDILYADTEIDRLLDGMKQRGLLQDTLVIVTSDHGEGLKSHPGVVGSKHHGTHLYDSVLHIPLFYWHPALKARRVSELSSSVDLVPTLLDVLGYDVPPALPGSSMAASLKGGTSEHPDFVIAETDWRKNKKVAVRTLTHKYVRNDDCKAYQEHGIFEGPKLDKKAKRYLTEVPLEELYAVGTEDVEDPTLTNVIDENAGIALTLAARAAEWEKQTPSKDPINRSKRDVLVLGDGSQVKTAKGPSEELDDATKEQLRLLGYLD